MKSLILQSQGGTKNNVSTTKVTHFDAWPCFLFKISSHIKKYFLQTPPTNTMHTDLPRLRKEPFRPLDIFTGHCSKRSHILLNEKQRGGGWILVFLPLFQPSYQEGSHVAQPESQCDLLDSKGSRILTMFSYFEKLISFWNVVFWFWLLVWPWPSVCHFRPHFYPRARSVAIFEYSWRLTSWHFKKTTIFFGGGSKTSARRFLWSLYSWGRLQEQPRFEAPRFVGETEVASVVNKKALPSFPHMSWFRAGKAQFIVATPFSCATQKCTFWWNATS